jgi:PD-(D/E)XK nuclease family transposase
LVLRLHFDRPDGDLYANALEFAFCYPPRLSGKRYPGDGIRCVFVELPHSHRVSHVDEPAAEWYRFLKAAGAWTSIPPNLRNPVIRQALQIARRANLNPEESTAMTRREMFKHDKTASIAYALEKGIEMGMEMGKKEERVSMALKMLSILPIESVAQVTGLTSTQLEALLPKALSSTTQSPQMNSTVQRKSARGLKGQS